MHTACMTWEGVNLVAGTPNTRVYQVLIVLQVGSGGGQWKPFVGFWSPYERLRAVLERLAEDICRSDVVVVLRRSLPASGWLHATAVSTF